MGVLTLLIPDVVRPSLSTKTMQNNHETGQPNWREDFGNR